ncbi:hypothetical protein [Sulfobacillus thermosulfidooxidans]|nr:hypothetical protein [Sulfobacillus thermosulfidooxidans]
MMKRTHQLAAALSAFTVFTAQPVFAISSRPDAHFSLTAPSVRQNWHHNLILFGEILAVSPTHISVFLPHRLVALQLSVKNLTVRAQNYPLSLTQATRILHTGELVQLHIHPHTKNVLSIQPLAYGTAVDTLNHWTLSVRERGTSSSKPWPLSTLQVPIFGSRSIKSGENIEVFGWAAQGVIHPTAVAVKPLHIKAQVKSKTEQYLHFADQQGHSYTINLSSQRPWLRQLAVNSPVILIVDPATQNILGVRPAHTHAHLIHCLSHNIYGQLVKKSPEQWQLKTSWGTESVSVQGRSIKIVGLNSHGVSTLNDLPLNSQLLIHFSPPPGPITVRIIRAGL